MLKIETIIVSILRLYRKDRPVKSSYCSFQLVRIMLLDLVTTVCIVRR